MSYYSEIPKSVKELAEEGRAGISFYSDFPYIRWIQVARTVLREVCIINAIINVLY